MTCLVANYETERELSQSICFRHHLSQSHSYRKQVAGDFDKSTSWPGTVG